METSISSNLGGSAAPTPDPAVDPPPAIGRRVVGPLLIATAAALCAAAPARAHDFWIEPSSFTPPAGSVLAVGLRVGEHFQGDPVPRDPDHIVRFDLTGAGGDSEVMGVGGWEPAGRVRVPEPGLHAVVYRTSPSKISLPGDRFEAYLKLEGLETVSAARAARGERDDPGREIYSRCAKALIDVQPPAGANSTGKAAAPWSDRPVGLTLELVAEADPYRLAAGGELAVRLLYEDKPLAGALVVAIPAGDPAAAQSARSDRGGRATFRLGQPGPWLIKAVHMIPAPAGSGADWESFWASLTFALPPG